MLKLGRVTKVKVLFLVLAFVFHFDLFKFSAAILEKGLLKGWHFPDSPPDEQGSIGDTIQYSLRDKFRKGLATIAVGKR